MKSVFEMNPMQIRHAYGKCPESFHKQMGLRKLRDYKPVSYTHLTLPTNREV